MIGALADRSRTLGKEVGTVEWSHGASDPRTGKALLVPWKIQEMSDILQEYKQRAQTNTRRGTKFNNYRLTAPTDLTQQTLRTMRPKHGMVENLIECCSFGMPTRGGNPTFQLWEENCQRQVRRLMRTGSMLAVEFSGAGPSVIPGTQISLSSLVMESKRPVTINKLSAEMIGLLEGYGKPKVEEWIQRALNRQQMLQKDS